MAANVNGLICLGFGDWSAVNWVVTMGFGTEEDALPTSLPPTGDMSLQYQVGDNRLHYSVAGNRFHYRVADNRLHYEVR